MKKFLAPMILLLSLFGCQAAPTMSQTNPIEQVKPIERQPVEPLPLSKREPVICTMQYDPVCATINDNGVLRQQTFGNRCATSNTDNIVNITPGECGSATLK